MKVTKRILRAVFVMLCAAMMVVGPGRMAGVTLATLLARQQSKTL